MSDSDSSEDRFTEKTIQQIDDEVKPSLRLNQSENVGVTKNYQEIFAKKLSEILER